MSKDTRTVATAALAIVAAILLALVAPATAVAQQHTVEITPTIGYRWGGEIQGEDTDLIDADADVDDAASYGLAIGLPVSRHFQIELLADHQSTRLRGGELFEPDSLGIDLDVTYYQVGLLFQWNPRYAKPYIVASLGVADIDPDVPGFSGETRFAGSLGGGVKVPLSDAVDFRLELRLFSADTDPDEWGWDDDCWDDDDCHWCDDGDCWDGDQDLAQAEVKVGLTVKL